MRWRDAVPSAGGGDESAGERGERVGWRKYGVPRTFCLPKRRAPIPNEASRSEAQRGRGKGLARSQLRGHIHTRRPHELGSLPRIEIDFELGRPPLCFVARRRGRHEARKATHRAPGDARSRCLSKSGVTRAKLPDGSGRQASMVEL